MKMRLLPSVLAFLAVTLGCLRVNAMYTVQGYYTLGSQTAKSDASVVFVDGTSNTSKDNTSKDLWFSSPTVTFRTKQPHSCSVLTSWTFTGYTSSSLLPEDEKTTTYHASETLMLTYSGCLSLGYVERGTQRLVANYRWFNYTLSYSENGGSWVGSEPGSPSLSYADTTTALAASRATMTGHYIASWNTASDGSGTKVACGASGVTGGTLGVTADDQFVTLYAQWAASSYAVTLSATDAENTPTTSVRATYGAAMPSIAVLPTRTGYTFGGYWTAANGGGTQYYDAKGASVRAWDRTAATTLYAKWTVKSCTVTFAVSGDGSGTVSPSGSRAYAYGTSVNVSATPSTGSKFDGWSDGETAASRTVTVTGNATYTANFSKMSYTLTFVYYNTSYERVSESKAYEYGDAVTPPSADNRPGYTFDGWSPSVPSTATENQTYTAQYKEKTYYVIFDGNGATSGRTLTQEFNYNDSKALNQCRYKRTGYSFLGWSEDKNAKTADYRDQETVSGLAEEGSITLYAVWQANSYTVEFDGNGETGGTMASQTFTYDKSQALRKNAFTKEGQTFVNWTTKDGRTFSDGETVSNLTDSGTITLTAEWSGNHFVVFDGNGATNTTMAVQTFTKTEEQALLPNAYEKTGYTFGGWATNEATAAALSPRYADEEVVSIDAPEGATNTLYAVWMTNSYSIVFHPSAADVIGTMETLSACAYDTEITLPECVYTNYMSSGFLGWAQTEGGEVAFEDGAAVSNLTAVANGTANLYAVWDDEGELSKAVGLTNAVLRDASTLGNAFRWKVTDDVSRTGGSCAVGITPLAGNGTVTMETTVVGSGTLSFYWRCGDGAGDNNLYQVMIDGVAVSVDSPTSDGWAKVELTLAEGTHTIAWANRKTTSDAARVLLYVDDVTWAPSSQTAEEFSYDDGSGVARTVSVPHSWVKQYFTDSEIKANGGYKALLEGSVNKTGWAVTRWQEYVAGTDPTDATSVFRVTSITVTDDGVELTWSPDLRKADPARVYTVFGKTALGDAAWEAVDYSTHHFFRVEVNLK